MVFIVMFGTVWYCLVFGTDTVARVLFFGGIGAERYRVEENIG
jgi:hypothetical protein